MVMTRYDKVLVLARRIDAARGRGRLKKKKAKEAAKRDREATTLDPDEYRTQHGRCPDGYEYDPLSDTCESKDGEPAEEREEEDREAEERDDAEREADEEKDEDAKDGDKKPPPERPPEPKTPGDWLDGRKQRGDYLEKLFHDDPDLYQQEADRMRESGELPDRETAEMLVKIKDIDDLPADVLKDKEKLAKVIAQQDAQRKIEEMVLERAEGELKDLEKQREIALKAGKKPPKLDPFKFLNDIEQMYNRDLIGDSEKIEKILTDQEDEFAKIVSDAATKPGEPAYWWKKWWEKATKPIPVWTPGKSDVMKSMGLDKFVGGSVEVTALNLHDLMFETHFGGIEDQREAIKQGRKRMKESLPLTAVSTMTLKDLARSKKKVTGPNGNDLVGYQWISRIEDEYSKREDGLVAKRVSDWDRALICTTCKRKIVHVYWVKDKDGKLQSYGADHLHIGLGYPSELRKNQVERLKKKIADVSVQQDEAAFHRKNYERYIELRAVPLAPDSVREANRRFMESGGRGNPPPVFLVNRRTRQAMRADDLAIDRFIDLMSGWEKATPQQVRTLVGAAAEAPAMPLGPEVRKHEVRSSAATAKTLTSQDVTCMEPREIGFPPYDRDRQPRKHIADEPSGRPAFPPYEPIEPVEYKARDARMQGFPPYDGKGEPGDTETVGLPPYNGKAPHEGRGFPPYHDGKNVYQHRRRTVDLAVT